MTIAEHRWWPRVRACGAWRGLDEAGKQRWLDDAFERHRVAVDRGDGPRGTSGATFTVDGADFDDLAGFLCAMGEAVNGPGGYFGGNLLSFDDCLFGGFGLEAPCTIRWLHAARSRVTLGSAALVRQCEDTIAWTLATDDPALFADVRDSATARAASAVLGEGSLFDDLVDCIRSVEERFTGRPGWAIRLELDDDAVAPGGEA